MSFVFPPPLEYGGNKFEPWCKYLGWGITLSSMSIIPSYILYAFVTAHGTVTQVSDHCNHAHS